MDGDNEKPNRENDERRGSPSFFAQLVSTLRKGEEVLPEALLAFCLQE